ncbi:hypothetical protein LOD99_5734 [Oopsacas minuta]|uniref:MICOS complex subunit n=1 Tax=Oopsacas minuta TaxID=111878 RepID=A0AAV7JPY7_9METZ|nr:hypothetical protein LOD99_5734 [Oopsacas minuta]
MTNNKPVKTIPNLSIYPDDVIDLPKPNNMKPESTPFIQPYVSDIRQAVQRTSLNLAQYARQNFVKFNTHWMKVNAFLHSENFHLSAIGVSSSLGTFLLVRKRKPIWRYSMPILVGVTLTGYAYIRKEWDKFDMYSNIIALQRRTPEEVNNISITKDENSNSENS